MCYLAAAGKLVDLAPILILNCKIDRNTANTEFTLNKFYSTVPDLDLSEKLFNFNLNVCVVISINISRTFPGINYANLKGMLWTFKQWMVVKMRVRCGISFLLLLKFSQKALSGSYKISQSISGPTFTPYVEPYIPAAPWCNVTSGGKECHNDANTRCRPLEGAADDGLCLCRSGFTRRRPGDLCESKLRVYVSFQNKKKKLSYCNLV